MTGILLFVHSPLVDPSMWAPVAAEMPRLPRDFYNEPVPMPYGWTKWRCGYVGLSDAYRDDFDEAGRRGWPREMVDGHHLSLVTEPAPVLNAISAVTEGISRMNTRCHGDDTRSTDQNL